MEKKATGEIDWDKSMADASATSWKDEWLTLAIQRPSDSIFLWGGWQKDSLRGV